MALVAGSINTAAYFLSRVLYKVMEKIRLKIREDFQTSPIEVTTSSSDVTGEEEFFLIQRDNENESAE